MPTSKRGNFRADFRYPLQYLQNNELSTNLCYEVIYYECTVWEAYDEASALVAAHMGGISLHAWEARLWDTMADMNKATPLAEPDAD